MEKTDVVLSNMVEQISSVLSTLAANHGEATFELALFAVQAQAWSAILQNFLFLIVGTLSYIIGRKCDNFFVREDDRYPSGFLKAMGLVVGVIFGIIFFVKVFDVPRLAAAFGSPEVWIASRVINSLF